MAKDLQGFGLALLNRFAGNRTVQKIKLDKAAEGVIFQASKTGFRTAGAANRGFKAVRDKLKPNRLEKPTGNAGLFDLNPTDEQSMMRDSVQRYAEERLRPAAYEADNACCAPAELLEEANDLGLSLMAIPEGAGGAGAEQSPVTNVLVTEALAHGDMGLAIAVLSPVAVANALARWGSGDQQATYLPAFVEDKQPQAAMAVMEPRPLFDPFLLQTTASKTADGYVLNGVKSMVPLAGQAELFLVAAEVESAGPALFIIPSDTQGLTIEADPGMGVRAASMGRLLLKNVTLPASALLGEEAGSSYAEFIQLSRIGSCALAVGACQAVQDYVIPYVNERKAFGEPISHRQAVAFMVSNIGIETEAMRLLTWRAASRAEQGLELGRDAALALTLCAEKGMNIGNDGVQLLGGHGFVKEHPVERWYRDLRAIGLMEGVVLV